jgi:hypothetical protein
MPKDGEIVGLYESSNGQSCASHECCGKHICLDVLVRFRLAVAEVEGRIEQAIQVVRVRDGSESCTIGFLQRNLVKSDKDKYVGKFAQIIELYENSENEVKRRKSHRNIGAASFRMLDDIQQQQ